MFFICISNNWRRAQNFEESPKLDELLLFLLRKYPDQLSTDHRRKGY